MNLSLVFPGIAVLLIAVAAGRVRWSGSPRVAVRVLAGVAGVVAVTSLLVVLTLATGFISRGSAALSMPDWCPRLTSHHRVGTVEGVASLTFLAFMAPRVARVFWHRHSAVKGTQGRHLAVLATEEPIAYAAPGKPGCVVVSRGILHQLDAEGRRVLFAHERAHLNQNHHRYLLLGSLAVAIVPLLGRLVGQLRIATERCADEAAVVAMGGDRRTVAMSIGQAAFATTAFRGSAGAFGGGSVPIRVEALLNEPGASLVRRLLIAAVLFTGAVMVASSVQIHHLYSLVSHVCGH